MCTGETGRVVGIDVDGAAQVLTCRGLTTASLLAAEEPVSAGDWVLMHSGFVLAVLTDEEAYASFAAHNHPAQARHEEAPG